MSLDKILYIVGPTATGKTDLAMSLGSMLSGALISADSIQVYKGLDIISGKDIPKGSQFFDISYKFESLKRDYKIGYYSVNSTPLFLLDVVYPSVNFSVSSFQKIAAPIIKSIIEDKKLPIVVGGTGFYIKSLTSGIETTVIPPSNNLRKKFERYSIEALQKKLKDIDKKKFESLNNSDRNNKRRLIRAIEITESRITNYPQKSSAYKLEVRGGNTTKPENLLIGLYCQKEILKKRIDERVEKRIGQGAFEEAKALFEQYNLLSTPVKTANGYKQLFQYYRNKLNREEAIERWKISEYAHAKNQMTWFQKQKEIKWFDIADVDFRSKIELAVKNWIK